MCKQVYLFFISQVETICLRSHQSGIEALTAHGALKLGIFVQREKQHMNSLHLTNIIPPCVFLNENNINLGEKHV